MTMSGIDIASYQSGLDLNNISYDFVAIKATEGVNYVNPYCDIHYQQARSQGKKRAVYMFSDFGDPTAEADFFVDNTTGYVGDSIFVLDWEGAGVGDISKALTILRRIRDRTGIKPAIYMSEWVENNYDWSPVVNEDFGLWIAKYSDYEIDNNYDMSGAGQAPNTLHWPFYFMWQWTSRGRLNGYAGDLDCDIAYVDGDGWDRYAGVPVAVPAPAPQPEPTTTTTTTEVAPEPVTTTTTTVVEVPVAPEPPTSETTATTTLAPQVTNEPVQKTGIWAIVILVLVTIFNRLRGIS